MRVGRKVVCSVCRLSKKPVGRDMPAASGSMCTGYECNGYWGHPRPDTLWPGESEDVVERSETIDG